MHPRSGARKAKRHHSQLLGPLGTTASLAQPLSRVVLRSACVGHVARARERPQRRSIHGAASRLAGSAHAAAAFRVSSRIETVFPAKHAFSASFRGTPTKSETSPPPRNMILTLNGAATPPTSEEALLRTRRSRRETHAVGLRRAVCVHAAIIHAQRRASVKGVCDALSVAYLLAVSARELLVVRVHGCFVRALQPSSRVPALHRVKQSSTSPKVRGSTPLQDSVRSLCRRPWIRARSTLARSPSRRCPRRRRRRSRRSQRCARVKRDVSAWLTRPLRRAPTRRHLRIRM